MAICWQPQVLSTSSSSQLLLEWVPRVYASSPMMVQCKHNIANILLERRVLFHLFSMIHKSTVHTYNLLRSFSFQHPCPLQGEILQVVSDPI